MSKRLLAVVESPMHPNFSALYAECGFEALAVNSQRKAIAVMKRDAPDVVVAEFFYGWGNNYAGVNVSNLDVMLYSLQRFAPQAKVVVLVDKAQRMYVEKLEALFELSVVLVQPVAADAMRECLLGLWD